MKNNDRLTYSQAVKVCYGENLLKSFLLSLCYPVIVMSSGLLMMFIMNPDEFRNDNSMFVYMLMNMSQSVFLLLFVMRRFDKNTPGGKFLRTVKGGFNTYERAVIAITIMLVFDSIVFCGGMAALEALGLITLKNAGRSCAMISLVFLTGVGIIGFFRNIKSNSGRTIAYSFVYILIVIAGMALSDITDGAEGYVFECILLILSFASVILITLSLYCHLKFYKKHCWDN